MRVQTTITVDEDMMLEAWEQVRQGSFKNKSQFFEHAAKKYLEANK